MNSLSIQCLIKFLYMGVLKYDENGHENVKTIQIITNKFEYDIFSKTSDFFVLTIKYT